jgi:hypothetical protein
VLVVVAVEQMGQTEERLAVAVQEAAALVLTQQQELLEPLILVAAVGVDHLLEVVLMAAQAAPALSLLKYLTT